MVHNLKIEQKHYRDITKGKKRFEIRYKDRNYKEDDILNLREWDGKNYTGREAKAQVTYILDDSKYLNKGYVAMSLKLIDYTMACR